MEEIIDKIKSLFEKNNLYEIELAPKDYLLLGRDDCSETHIISMTRKGVNVRVEYDEDNIDYCFMQYDWLSNKVLIMVWWWVLYDISQRQ